MGRGRKKRTENREQRTEKREKRKEKRERRKKKEESRKENFAIKASAHACVMPSQSKVKPPKVG